MRVAVRSDIERGIPSGSALFRVPIWHKAEHQSMHQSMQAGKGGEGVGF